MNDVHPEDLSQHGSFFGSEVNVCKILHYNLENKFVNYPKISICSANRNKLNKNYILCGFDNFIKYFSYNKSQNMYLLKIKIKKCKNIRN